MNDRPLTQQGRVSVGSVVVDCNDLRTMREFWQKALGYVTTGLVEDDFLIPPFASAGA